MQLSELNNRISEPIVEKRDVENEHPPVGGKTILLIDDEPMVTDIGEMMLKGLGHKVLKANGGGEGIRLFEANRDDIDLIISDFEMPGMNGQQVVDRLKKMDGNVKVLLSSGGLSASQAESAIVCGFDGFLRKPYNMDMLSRKIAEILN